METKSGFRYTTFVIRSRANDGSTAKQYFSVAKSDEHEPSLIVKKLTLTDNYALYTRTYEHRLVREFKGRWLFETRWSIRLSTLNLAITKINSIVDTI
jgi:hypothetical protein